MFVCVEKSEAGRKDEKRCVVVLNSAEQKDLGEDFLRGCNVKKSTGPDGHLSLRFAGAPRLGPPLLLTSIRTHVLSVSFVLRLACSYYWGLTVAITLALDVPVVPLNISTSIPTTSQMSKHNPQYYLHIAPWLYGAKLDSEASHSSRLGKAQTVEYAPYPSQARPSLRRVGCIPFWF